MTDPGAAKGRSRRRRSAAPRPSSAPAATPGDLVADSSRDEPARRPKRDHGDRGLRDLVGAGPSQLGVSGALRGRDVNRPTDADLAEAERDIVIVRPALEAPRLSRTDR